MLQAIEQAIKRHDKYQIEIKLDYELLEGKKTSYQVSTYLFIPQNLGINRHTYSKADFYRDIQTQKEKIYKRLRLILNQEGIKRIEHVPV